MALTLSQFETLDGAYDALLRAGDFMTCADPRGYIRKSNILLDACIDAGMSRDEADHVAWAGERVTRALLGGTACRCGEGVAHGRTISMFGNYERACTACADAAALEAA